MYRDWTAVVRGSGHPHCLPGGRFGGVQASKIDRRLGHLHATSGTAIISEARE